MLYVGHVTLGMSCGVLESSKVEEREGYLFNVMNEMNINESCKCPDTVHNSLFQRDGFSQQRTSFFSVQIRPQMMEILIRLCF